MITSELPEQLLKEILEKSTVRQSIVNLIAIGAHVPTTYSIIRLVNT